VLAWCCPPRAARLVLPAWCCLLGAGFLVVIAWSRSRLLITGIARSVFPAWWCSSVVIFGRSGLCGAPPSPERREGLGSRLVLAADIRTHAFHDAWSIPPHVTLLGPTVLDPAHRIVPADAHTRRGHDSSPSGQPGRRSIALTVRHTFLTPTSSILADAPSPDPVPRTRRPRSVGRKKGHASRRSRNPGGGHRSRDRPRPFERQRGSSRRSGRCAASHPRNLGEHADHMTTHHGLAQSPRVPGFLGSWVPGFLGSWDMTRSSGADATQRPDDTLSRSVAPASRALARADSPRGLPHQAPPPSRMNTTHPAAAPRRAADRSSGANSSARFHTNVTAEVARPSRASTVR